MSKSDRLEFSRRNTEQWDKRLLRKDLEDLRREQVHLRSKSYVRPLTDWELDRIYQISREIITLIKQFGQVGIASTK